MDISFCERMKFFQMFHIVEFDDTSIAVAHDKWMVDSTTVMWPGYNSKKTDDLLVRGRSPPPTAKLFKVKTIRVTGMFSFMSTSYN